MTWLSLPLALFATVLLVLAVGFMPRAMFEPQAWRIVVACFCAGVPLLFIAGRWSAL